ncbi:hypothetical protein [Sporichthya sp.]|uniref:hypothetical protein n=1 Tax=Sporichthya sp. TaxID=65475 RepID=UPI001843BCE2|nr:hypothetical protein [Sporichthya sp.]MBA3744400.1 hypothetical protein [Sporichthya sp.]
MRVRPRLVVPFSAVLVAVPVAGCGDSGGSGDDAEITELARVVVTARQGDEVCRTRLTEDFVRTAFGDVDVCVTSGISDDPADVATGASVTDIEVDGDTATAVVAEQGGQADGARGTWAFAREAEGWRVAEWRIDYLRSTFAAEIGPAYRPAGPEDPFADPAARACVSGKFQALADPEFRSTAFEILRGSQAGEATLRGWYNDCVPGAKGVSTLRRDFEEVLRQADIPAEVIDCAVLKLRETVTDAEIRTMGKSGAAAPPPAVQKRIEKATVECIESTQA